MASLFGGQYNALAENLFKQPAHQNALRAPAGQQRNVRADTLTAYHPTLRDRAANALLSLVGDTYESQNLFRKAIGSSGLGAAGLSAVDFVPVAGSIFQADEGGRQMASGHPWQGAANVAMAVVPVPAAAKGARAARRSLSELQQEAARRGVDLYISEGPRGLILSKIVVPKEARGKGVGSGVMREVLDYADSTGQRVMLTPDGAFGGSVPRLKKFYGNMGFVQNAGRAKDYSVSETMYRDPIVRALKDDPK